MRPARVYGHDWASAGLPSTNLLPVGLVAAACTRQQQPGERHPEQRRAGGFGDDGDRNGAGIDEQVAPVTGLAELSVGAERLVRVGGTAITSQAAVAIGVAEPIEVALPRSTVDWDTSQADDFRRRGEPWKTK